MLAGGALGRPVSGPLAGGRVWTCRVAFGVVDPGRWRGRGLGPFAGAWCPRVARAGRLWLPYLCRWAFFPPQQVVLGAPGLLWPRGAPAGVVVPPVWLQVLAGAFVACRHPMVPERPLSLLLRLSAAGVVSGRSRWGWRWMGRRTWRSLGFLGRWSPMVPERVHL